MEEKPGHNLTTPAPDDQEEEEEEEEEDRGSLKRSDWLHNNQCPCSHVGQSAC